MAKSLSQQPVLFPINAAAVRKARQAAVLVLGLALVTVPPQVVFGQSNQQQEQQQREQQEREQQQRAQQQREQQEREQQQRDQQQREQQQAREQQQRDQQQREQQERMQQQEHSSSDFPAPSSNASSDSRPTGQAPAADVKRTNSDIQPRSAERKVNSASAGNASATKDHASSAVQPDLRGRVCEDGPCKEPAVQLKPVAPEPPGKVCKDGPCKPCPKGQSEGKDGSCGPPPAVLKNGNVPGFGSARTAVHQPCPAGQVWDGAQCLIIGSQQCLPSQSRVGTSCQTDCAISTTSGQNIIMELRSARLHKDDICRQNPTGMECQQAEAHYNLEFTEYQNFLAGVPTECRTALPDPIAI